MNHTFFKGDAGGESGDCFLAGFVAASGGHRLHRGKNLPIQDRCVCRILNLDLGTRGEDGREGDEESRDVILKPFHRSC